MPNFLSEQGSSTGGGWQAAAVQREPEKEEGAEGEKAAEEGRWVQPAGADVFHPWQQPLANSTILEPWVLGQNADAS